MISNGEFASRVVNGLKALTKDSRISWRYIVHIGKIKSKFLMAQKLDEMTLFKEDGIITSINCFRMKKVKSKDCGIVEFNLCDDLMKSCEQLPEGLFGKNGSSIISVSNIDGSRDYRYISPNRYTELKKRKYRKNGAGYYYIKDGYLYLPDSNNELLDISMIALDIDEADSLSSCDDSNSSPSSSCTLKLESDFVSPDRFLDMVARDTIQEIANFYRTSTKDENPNLDENQKSKTVN